MGAPPPLELDLRGVRCPLSWARAKVRLEGLAPDTELVLRVDEERGARDIPRAAEAERYEVLEVSGPRGGEWRIVLRT